jgi:hypothetical protein
MHVVVMCLCCENTGFFSPVLCYTQPCMCPLLCALCVAFAPHHERCCEGRHGTAATLYHNIAL